MHSDDAAVSIPRVSRPALAAAVTAAWEVEPEPTVAGLANALTRAAHEAAWPSPHQAAARLQAAAGVVIDLDPRAWQAAIHESTTLPGAEHPVPSPAMRGMMRDVRRVADRAEAPFA